MLKRKLLAMLVIICMLSSILGLPALATTQEILPVETQEEQSTVTSVQATPVSSTGELLGVGDSQGTGSEDSKSDYESSEVPASAGQSEDNASSSASGGGVSVSVDENVDTTVDSKADAESGQSSAAGTQATNSVSSLSAATAKGDSGSEDNDSGSAAVAENEQTDSVENNGTARSASGPAQAGNEMGENTINITPETTATVEVLGKVIDSNVVIKYLYNYWANITGQALALSGTTTANGLVADNSINSTDTAYARSDSPAGDGYGYDGSAAALNNTQNCIGNNGSAVAVSGGAQADNFMFGNDIWIAPIIGSLIKFCGDIVNSNVTIELVYNFLAILAGTATATSGDATAAGAYVGNKINNYSDAKAIGDAPADAGEGGFLDGSAEALNQTTNGIYNSGEGGAVSGNARSLNEMTNNDIVIAPTLMDELIFLDSLMNMDIAIRINYNFQAAILGEANATTGNADALGLMADNSIDNTSTASARGDAPTSGENGDAISGEAVSTNNTNNLIGNNGKALSATGDANAKNIMTDNKVNLSPVIYNVIMVAKPIIEGSKIIIDITYDIWTLIMGSANATTGNSSAVGVISSNWIDSVVAAMAYGEAGPNGSSGSAMAFNSFRNGIFNDGQGYALSGNADAYSNMSAGNASVTGTLGGIFKAGGLEGEDSVVSDNAIGLEMIQDASAATGDASSFGSVATSGIAAGTEGIGTLARGGSASNENENIIFNKGKSIAYTRDASAAVGKPDNAGGGNGGDTGGNDPSNPGSGTSKPPASGGSTPGNGGDSSSPSGFGRLIHTIAYIASSFRPWKTIKNLGRGVYNTLSDALGLESGDGEEYNIEKSSPGVVAGERVGKHSAKGPFSWVWALIAFMFAVWAALTIKAKPWQRLRTR